MRSLEGKVAVVTGASRGVGRGIALQLAQAGCTLFITARKPEESLSNTLQFLPTLSETANECRQRGAKCYEMYVDHSNMDEVEEFFSQVSLMTSGRLDILVNNAYSAVSACGNKGQRFFEQEPQIWDEINNVGLRNQYFCSVFGARMMVPNGDGLIVNISSLGGQIYLFNVPYGAGKTAIDRMSADMARELEGSGVTVISMWPGAVKTELILNSLEKSQGDWGNAANSMFLRGESIEYAGIGVVRIASDLNRHRYNGRILISTDLAEIYGFKDLNGKHPVNIRSLYHLLHLNGYTNLGKWIPEFVKIPGWLITLSQNRI